MRSATCSGHASGLKPEAPHLVPRDRYPTVDVDSVTSKGGFGSELAGLFEWLESGSVSLFRHRLKFVPPTIDGQPDRKHRPEGFDLHCAGIASLVAECPPDPPVGQRLAETSKRCPRMISSIGSTSVSTIQSFLLLMVKGIHAATPILPQPRSRKNSVPPPQFRHTAHASA